MTSAAGSNEGVVWCGPVFDPSGYADEGRGLLCALEQAGVPVALRPIHRFAPGFREGLPAQERKTLEKQAQRALPRHQVLIQHHTADGFFRIDNNAYRVGRTMFETDAIPPNWVRHCNEMDELWLPSQFNIDTFQRAGVHVPIVKVPGGIDSTFFHPGVAPISVSGLRGTVFLAVFEWRLRKGWDVLLRAWANAFSPADDVTLVLRTYPIDKVSGSDNETVINERIDAFLRDEMGRSRQDVAPIVVLGKTVPGAAMPSLYRIATVLVAPTRGEGWGRPFMEAMASGVPVIATRWSAHLEFMNDDNSLLLDIDDTEEADGVEVPLYLGQRWAAPSVSHLCDLLQRVHRQPEAMRTLGSRARNDMVTSWPWSRAAEVMVSRLREIRALSAVHRQRPRTGSAPTAPAAEQPVRPCLYVDARLFDRAIGESTADRVIGHLIDHWPHRALVHTRVAAPLRPPMSSPIMHAYRSCVLPDDSEAPADMADIPQTRTNDTVLTWLDGAAHQQTTRPACAYWAVHTGDIVGHEVPRKWVRILRDTADDVWVPSVQAYQACLQAGIAAHRLWLMPPVAAPDHVTAEGARMPLPNRSDTVFLLPAVDVSQSEAVNTVLKTWQRAFDATQSVVLIVYAPESTIASVNAWHQRLIATLASGRFLLGAPIQLWRDPLGFDELVTLVRSADVVVDPCPTPSTLPFLQTAFATHRAVVSGGRPEAVLAVAGQTVDEAHLASWHVQQVSGAGTVSAWRDVLRAATDRTERAVRVERGHRRATAVLASAEHTAIAAVRRLLDGAHRGDARHLALVSNLNAPFTIYGAKATTILAHVDWHDGTGRGVLQSYARSFGSTDDVSLVLCLDPEQGFTVEQVASFANDAMHLAGKDEGEAPDIILVQDVLTDEIRSALITRCDAVVAVHDSLIGQAALLRARRVISTLSTSSWRSVLQSPLVPA